MKPDPRFLNQPKHFWANVRSISERVGYSARGTGQILVPDLDKIVSALGKLGLSTEHVLEKDGGPTATGNLLLAYFACRSDLLMNCVKPRLMDADQAEALFERVRKTTKSKLSVPMNKQTGKKKKPAYLTAIVNMLIEANVGGLGFDYDPHKLTAFTRFRVPLRTLARRVDGAFPSTINPIAIWEIKEYYHTKTFGSRVADGVYETLLDGMELEELRRSEQVVCKHYLITDDQFNWWNKGRSYLCRFVDMLHMGYVDEVLIGTEVVDRIPSLAREWVELLKTRDAQK